MWVPDQGLDITVFDTGTSNQTNCERLDTNDEVTQYRVPFCWVSRNRSLIVNLFWKKGYLAVGSLEQSDKL
jgi:hypothetical protein